MYQLVGTGGEGALLCPYRPFADATKNLFLARWVFGRVEWDPTARGLATDRCGGVNREVLGTVYTGKRGPDEKKKFRLLRDIVPFGAAARFFKNTFRYAIS